jgi:hypothetical protein
MNYPDGFPSRLRPRLDAAILNLRKKYPLAGGAFQRISETISAYVEITCSAIEKGEVDVGSAHSSLEEFALELCQDHADMTAQPWWNDKAWDDYVEWMRSKIIYSNEWLGHLNRLAALAEQPKSLSAPQDESVAIQLKELFEECRMTCEDVAEAIGIEPRSVYRHLSGEAVPRKRQLGGYEKLFSDKLKRQVRLRRSGKRQ